MELSRAVRIITLFLAWSVPKIIWALLHSA
jgi:hypothetical protein